MDSVLIRQCCFVRTEVLVYNSSTHIEYWALYEAHKFTPVFSSTLQNLRAKMDQITFYYSTKNIPIASRSAYLKRLIEKTESFLKRVRWKPFYFLNPKTAENKHEYYGFNSQKSPPAVNELKDFEPTNPNYQIRRKAKRIPENCTKTWKQ